MEEKKGEGWRTGREVTGMDRLTTCEGKKGMENKRKGGGRGEQDGK